MLVLACLTAQNVTTCISWTCKSVTTAPKRLKAAWNARRRVASSVRKAITEKTEGVRSARISGAVLRASMTSGAKPA